MGKSFYFFKMAIKLAGLVPKSRVGRVSRNTPTGDLTDKPNQNPNRIESKSGEESKGDINIS